MSILQIEQPIVINKTLAEFIGINEAIVLQQINYWVCFNKKMQKNFYNNKYWTYNSISKWRDENFPFWSISTVRRIFDNLVEKDLLIKIEDPTNSMNNIFWYTINEESLNKLEEQYKNYEENLTNSTNHNYLEQDTEYTEVNCEDIETNNSVIIAVQNEYTPSQIDKTPSQIEQVSSQIDKTPSQIEQVSSQIDKTPSQIDYATLITKTNQIYNKNNNTCVRNITPELKNKIDCFTRNKILNKLLVDYVLMREKMNCSLSLDQLTMLLKRLDNLSKFTDTQISIVEQSIMGGYKSFFPVKSSKTYYKSKMDDYYISDKRQTDDYTESELKELLGISEEYGRFVGAQ